METEARSEECVEYLDDTGVAMKNAASLGTSPIMQLVSPTMPRASADCVAGPEKDGFHFDRVFDTNSQQEDIFDWGVKGIVEGELQRICPPLQYDIQLTGKMS
jgi:kinesin family protein 5